MSIQREELSKALVDVRNAYRLLHAYHKRTCDLFQTVNETVAKAGLRFERWDPVNVNALKPKQPFFAPYNYAWDLTPGYQIQPQWSDKPKKGAKSGRARRIVLAAIADTGYDNPEGIDPDPAKFKPSEEVATQIWIRFWTAATPAPTWVDAAAKLETLPTPYDGDVKTLKIKGVDYTYQYSEVDVADLVDDAAVKTKLLAPIEAWLNAKKP